MKLIPSSALAAVLFGLACRGLVAQEDLKLGDFRWRSDLDAARNDASASGRPLLVVFR